MIVTKNYNQAAALIPKFVTGGAVNFQSLAPTFHNMAQGDAALTQADITFDFTNAVPGSSVYLKYNDALALSLGAGFVVMTDQFLANEDVYYFFKYVNPDLTIVNLNTQGGFGGGTPAGAPDAITAALSAVPGLIYLANAHSVGSLTPAGGSPPPADGNALEAVGDESNNGRDATQTTAAQQPTYNATNESIDFSGGDNILLVGGSKIPINSGATTIVLAYEMVAGANQFIAGDTGDNNGYIQLRTDQIRITGNWQLSVTTGFFSGRCIIILTYDAGTLKAFKNGSTVEESSLSGGSSIVTDLDIIGNYSTSDFLQAFTGELYAFGVYSRPITTQEMTDIYNAINAEYAIY